VKGQFTHVNKVQVNPTGQGLAAFGRLGNAFALSAVNTAPSRPAVTKTVLRKPGSKTVVRTTPTRLEIAYVAKGDAVSPEAVATALGIAQYAGAVDKLGAAITNVARLATARFQVHPGGGDYHTGPLRQGEVALQLSPKGGLKAHYAQLEVVQPGFQTIADAANRVLDVAITRDRFVLDSHRPMPGTMRLASVELTR